MFSEKKVTDFPCRQLLSVSPYKYPQCFPTHPTIVPEQPPPDVYKRQLYTTLSIAKTMDEMNRLAYGKAREDLILQISQMYYLGQVTAEQIILIKANSEFRIVCFLSA